MKKILIVLSILTLICINVAFADTPPRTVLQTASEAVDVTEGILPGFNSSFVRCYDYAVSNNYITVGQKYILFPLDVYIVPISMGRATVHANYQLIVSNSNDINEKFVVTSYNVGVTYGNLEGHYDLWVGYTGDWSDLTGYIFSEQYDYYTLNVIDSFGMPNNNTSTIVDKWGNRWQTNIKNGENTSSYLLVSDYHNVAQFGGLYYSVYCNQDVLPTYYNNKFAGTGYWDDWNVLNPDYVINVFRSSNDNIAIINTEVYTTSTGIFFDNNNSDSQITSQNLDSFWRSLASTLLGLTSAFSSILGLITSVFAFLPVEIRSLIYTGLFFCIVLLIIKAVRGG